MDILITGGAGYIGSHTAVQALDKGHDVHIIDNLNNSNGIVLSKIEQITGKTLKFYNGDVRDSQFLDTVFLKHKIDLVIHFAGLKAVGESHKFPLEYFDVNVNGTLKLTKAMAKAGVKKLIFSSSATVYGVEAVIPYVETQSTGTTTSPYGTSKSVVEKMLTDLSSSDPGWSIVLLRYFNPIGAHSSGKIGEDPKGIPNNLIPFLAQVAVGKREKLLVFGNDYDTKDGTCERDYVHVIDLADGHLCAINSLKYKGIKTYNLGTGTPTSVLEAITAFEKASNLKINYEFSHRRAGDLAAFWADARKAEMELNWKAKRSLNQMMKDTWNWQKKNPSGF